MKLSWTRQELHLRHTFTIARGSQAVAETLLVQIEHDGLCGFGEAVPNPYYHQDLASAEAALAQMQPLLGNDPFRLQTILEAVLQRFDHQRATVAALDAALHDWIGKRLNVPVWRLLGLDPARVPLTSFTIGIDDLGAIARKVSEAADYPILKVKLGTEYDLDILRTIRGLAPHKRLRADANAAWSPRQAIARLREIAPFDVQFIEQPVPPGDNAALAEVRRAAILPVVADESCVRPADLPALAGCVDGVNIKLSKCGGIRQAFQMIHLARGLGLRVMLGCMIESSLGIAAAAQLAPLADWLDLDGHLLVADDPFAGIGGAGGNLTLSAQPGLGVHRGP
jgi:L-alanine-DL-glutamate epimerase-like enolase superfamily enzyme